MASKYDKAREALHELMDALRERHSAMHKVVQFAEERHETGLGTYQQALHACKYWLELGQKVEDALRAASGGEGQS